ncbi:hypothetical protein V6582_20775 (plasmid) [Agrobacterium vitis]|uniref:hypothetical protein n=1 Tax=Agrobacterium vitis TaxID=373 RepID=UPI0012E80D37|nr:hypothetical protein [Agrobacterium vitis]MVA27269.1 hypothetical protein [Agrobacterium vitis]
MRSILISAAMIAFCASPAAAEVGCDGKLVPATGGFYSARVMCTNTEKANQGYKCSGTWRLIGEDDKEYAFDDPVTTIAKGSVNVLKYENDRVGNGEKIKGQAHPYEGKCEL